MSETALFNSEQISQDNQHDARQYLVLARKHRPIQFGQLVGQSVLTTVITNAIKAGKVPHAFMLVGIRGVGKTTTARIIAKVLNCHNPQHSESGFIEPCNKCSSCVSIMEDRSQDVLEMDAASNNSVLDIRDIVENCRYKPIGNYKIYIIDEVHMLSNSAFNALLKTLEEPPAHVKFIFATTEIRKIPLTILSRCIRFDLKRLSNADLVSHFQSVLNHENISCSKEALELVATAAQGSVRDGLSILEQAISHTQGALDYKSVREILGMADTEITFNLLNAALDRRYEEVISLVAQCFALSYDPASILDDIMDILHKTSRYILEPKTENLLLEHEKIWVMNLAKKIDEAKAIRAWMMLSKAAADLQKSYRPFAALEMALLRIAHINNLISPEELIASINVGDLSGIKKK